MDKYEHVDLLLGQALECMVEAAGELKSIKKTNHFNETKDIGTAIGYLWKVRDEIYRIKPEIKRDFVEENQENKQRYEALDTIFNKARMYEHQGDKKAATMHFKELLEKSECGYFTLLAQAGLYRLLNEKET